MEKISEYIKDLTEKYHKEVENLTRDQFEIALKQAIESGDFIRATMQKHSPIGASMQGIYYIPYNLVSENRKLRGRVVRLEDLLEKIEDLSPFTHYMTGQSLSPEHEDVEDELSQYWAAKRDK